ncbi:lysophospholipid acyltransferase family protein [[Mycobacterium] nativiensis]|uniref:Lysophospholipid acyltransferase family protein n=1 Tax=[Mycobacterium] nativiensis TaxID=2855503 RepID=A0ABU5Y2Z4_9MYCO|nr:lysophospholipid acyltransferase family protein [Mycolicibacter sp. MYC340]MEB3033596.1 lysophospholipid acyltransferase family protein [Mycolicibacter sp. MYC340]
MELWYGSVATTARTLWRFQGLKITVTGAEHLPATGGAVIAINHTGYLDFTFAGMASYLGKPRRRVRFMVKQETFDNRFTGPVMRGCKHIAVDRTRGADAYQAAVEYLKAGELLGVYPEATISRSFELREFKSGAARMAIDAQVPIIPHIVWGAQRIWTKDHPKRLGRIKVPISVTIGEPIMPTLPVDDLRALLQTRMQHLLEQTQDAYPEHPAGAYWVPRRLGGGAPTPAEAAELDAAEAARKAEKRAAAGKQPPSPTSAAE